MVSKVPRPKGIRNDPQLSDPLHDELTRATMAWLRERIPLAYGLKQEAFANEINRANEAARTKLQQLEKDCREEANGTDSEKLPKSMRQALLAKAGEIKAYLKKFPLAEPPTGTDLAIVTGIERQKEITQRVGRDFNRRDELVGYIDLAVSIKVPTRLSYDCFDKPYGSYSTGAGALENKISEDIEPLLGIKFGASKRYVNQEDRRLWVDVRTKTPTVGEAVRDLRQYKQHSHAPLWMVVPSCTKEFREELRDEGFGVLTAHDLGVKLEPDAPKKKRRPSP
jgi:hypothetical protein